MSIHFGKKPSKVGCWFAFIISSFLLHQPNTLIGSVFCNHIVALPAKMMCNSWPTYHQSPNCHQQAWPYSASYLQRIKCDVWKSRIRCCIITLPYTKWSILDMHPLIFWPTPSKLDKNGQEKLLNIRGTDKDTKFDYRTFNSLLLSNLKQANKTLLAMLVKPSSKFEQPRRQASIFDHNN